MQVEEKTMTEQEIKEQKERMLEFYTDNMHYLKAQVEYEELIARLDNARLQSLRAKLEYMMITSETSEKPETDKKPSKKTLRRE